MDILLNDEWIFGLSHGVRVGKFQLKELNKVLTEICKFEIDTAFRGRGFGREMLDKAIELVKTPCATATVRVDNYAWVGTNIKAGFRIIHRIEKKTGDLYLFLKSKQFQYPR